MLPSHQFHRILLSFDRFNLANSIELAVDFGSDSVLLFVVRYAALTTLEPGRLVPAAVIPSVANADDQADRANYNGDYDPHLTAAFLTIHLSIR